MKERSKVFSEGLLAVNESETLNRSFTIILAVHKPYVFVTCYIMLHVTYAYIMQVDLQTAQGPETLLTFYPTYDWELAFHIYRESSLVSGYT